MLRVNTPHIVKMNTLDMIKKAHTHTHTRHANKKTLHVLKINTLDILRMNTD